MQKINETYILEQYENNRSTYDIAKELNTYAKKIERILKKNGHKLRDKKEAQKAALESGSAQHPTMGRKRNESEKNKISSSLADRWKNMSKEKKADICKDAKERWKKIPADKKREIQEMAGRALRQASVDGSKAEKSLKSKLQNEGYDVVMHKDNLISGNFEIDLFLPQIKTIIEIDGPQHFLPIWGMERLQKTIKSDEIKNGLLISSGYCVIRIKYMCKTINRTIENKLWGLVRPHVEKIKESFPDKGKRFIELEIS
jgi:very-short-patch-repair endonuclease